MVAVYSGESKKWLGSGYDGVFSVILSPLRMGKKKNKSKKALMVIEHEALCLFKLNVTEP
ncbi:hypothetical protein A7Q09_06815 [Methylacidiphilum sp. Yel]|jgi:hypothetical protein|uniref:hypothetical protein n=1 Tax=Methylacidiphilum sp. Yel TaxID=1847730 RepID=UPI001102D32F|nr:hypothetical protein [Methylacidiphilum sp. Yel]TFE68483.1 hypothetical protein A7Q09_06815 [Methylacidiphilum sp. Yel]